MNKILIDILKIAASTKNIKVENPSIESLPDGAWNKWNIDKLVSHFTNLANKKGRGKISKSIENIIRWNKTKNKKLSSKAESVMKKFINKMDKKKANNEN